MRHEIRLYVRAVFRCSTVQMAIRVILNPNTHYSYPSSSSFPRMPLLFQISLQKDPAGPAGRRVFISPNLRLHAADPVRVYAEGETSHKGGGR